MEAQATAKYVRSTPRKARLVGDAVRGRMVGEALSLLSFGITKDVARDVSKVVKSAVANLQSKNAEASIDLDGLRLREIRIDEGPVLHRFRARAQGRVGRIQKRMCHITVTVSDS